MSVKKYGWAIQKSLFVYTNQDSTFSHTHENSKIFNITSKYFSFFDNKPPASWVAHITRDFLICHSCFNDFLFPDSCFLIQWSYTVTQRQLSTTRKMTKHWTVMLKNAENQRYHRRWKAVKDIWFASLNERQCGNLNFDELYLGGETIRN